MKQWIIWIIIGVLLIGFIFMSLIVRDILSLIEDITTILINKTEEILP